MEKNCTPFFSGIDATMKSDSTSEELSLVILSLPRFAAQTTDRKSLSNFVFFQ